MATVRDTFKTRHDIDQFIQQLNVGEIDQSATNNHPWNYKKEGLYREFGFMGERTDDKGLSLGEQGRLDDYLEDQLEQKLQLNSTRAHDTCIMDEVHKRVIELMETHKITDASQIEVKMIGQ